MKYSHIKKDLIKHMHKHTEEQPYQCKECDKAFPNSNDLATHQQTHTREIPFKCTDYDEAFSDNSSLIGHIHTLGRNLFISVTIVIKHFQRQFILQHTNRHTQERKLLNA